MFITLEGMEGCGKSTLQKSLNDFLCQKGHEVLCSREPGGSELGKEIRKILLASQSPLCPEAELFLFLADRSQHVQSLLKPALLSGKWVICDRYADSTIVYQGYGRGLNLDKLIALNEEAVQGLWPNVTFLLDVPPTVGLERAFSRAGKEGADETAVNRFEKEALAFHTRVRQGFLDWGKRNADRFVVLDATQSPDEVLQEALLALEKRALFLVAP